MRRVHVLTVAAVASAFLACSADDGTQRLGRTAEPVINGVLDVGTTHDAIVLIQILIDPKTGQGAGCTGTAITPHLVITARHCVSALNESTGVFGADYPAENFGIWFGTSPRGDADARIARVIHPSGSTIDNNDFAMLVLKTPAKVISPIRLAGPPVKNESTTVVGYGLTTSDTGAPSFQLHERYKRDGVKIAFVGPIPTYGLGDKEFVMGESICQGDSGGPVLHQSTAALVGVVSRGGNGTKPTAGKPWAGCVNDTYAAQNIFTRVDGFTDLINKTAADLGEVVWEEGSPKPTPGPGPTPPPPGALGAVCASPGECTSSVCVDLGSGKTICSQACSAATPCPADFDCSGGYCVPHDPSAPPVTDPPPADTPPAADTGSSGKKCSISHVASESDVGGGWFAAAGLAFIALRRRRSFALR